MKLNQLKLLIKKVIKESKASDEAHKKGLESAGFGHWKDKSGKIVATTSDDKLVFNKNKDDKKEKSEQKNDEDLFKVDKEDRLYNEDLDDNGNEILNYASKKYPKVDTNILKKRVERMMNDDYYIDDDTGFVDRKKFKNRLNTIFK